MEEFMIGDKDLDKLCELAKIEVEDGNRTEFLRKLNSIFDWIDQLREIDVSGISGINGTGVSEEIYIDSERSDFLERPDEQVLTNSRESLMENTKYQKFGMFCVPKVVD
jgi:aspartyl/glutamyl-tRNA(Asn/Gln) amidotransferase C subunit